MTAISTTKAAQNGLLIRQRLALEAARDIDVVLFDKTGTLTKGEQGVGNVIADDEKELIRLAASLSRKPNTSIARAIVAAAKERKIRLSEAHGFSAFGSVAVQPLR